MEANPSSLLLAGAGILGLLEAAASRLAARGKGLRVWLELALNSFQDALVSASILFIIMLGNARVMSVCC